MPEQTVIPAPARAHNARLSSYLLLLPVCLILCTFLRISLLLAYPFIVFVLVYFYRFKTGGFFNFLLVFCAVSLGLSLIYDPAWKYNTVSLYYMIPFLFLLFAMPQPTRRNDADHLKIFFQCITVFLVLNDIIGIIQVLRNSFSDDSFMGIYSDYSVSLNGLMLLNAVSFFYYFSSYLHRRRLSHLWIGIFFLVCAILGYYGAGLLICIIAFVLTFFRLNILAIGKTMLIAGVSVLIVYLAMLYLKPETLNYNIANVKKLASFDPVNGPRKLTSFYNYGISYPKNSVHFIFGSGPGTFNSRSAFMVGSPSYFNKLSFIKDADQPYYFRHFAYTLWNEQNTMKSHYLDGFRNQPFSSLLAFLGEYGILFTLFFFTFYLMYYRSVARLYRRGSNDPQRSFLFRFFKFLTILLPLLLVIDNYFEYPEIMLFTILAMKFAHAGLVSEDVSADQSSTI